MKAVVSLLSLVSSGLISTAAAENWPAWRGADGTGISSERDLPTTWDAGRNIRWKRALPEPCNSTPVIWEDQVFFTQGLDNGRRRELIAVEVSPIILVPTGTCKTYLRSVTATRQSLLASRCKGPIPHTPTTVPHPSLLPPMAPPAMPYLVLF